MSSISKLETQKSKALKFLDSYGYIIRTHELHNNIFDYEDILRNLGTALEHCISVQQFGMAIRLFDEYIGMMGALNELLKKEARSTIKISKSCVHLYRSSLLLLSASIL